MVYRLIRDTDHAALREAALPYPEVELPTPLLHPGPLVVWGAPAPGRLVLDNTLREVILSVHNAGAAAGRVIAVHSTAPWLHPHGPGGVLPPDGERVPVSLRLRPEGLRSGDYQATVRLQVRFVGRKSQTLERRLQLSVPPGPLPWFDEPAVAFAGAWPRRQVRLKAERPTDIYYGEHHLTPTLDAHTYSLYPGEYRLVGAPDTEAAVQLDSLLPRMLPVPCRWRVTGALARVKLRNLGSLPLQVRLATSAPWLYALPQEVALGPGEATEVILECCDDGRHWDDTAAELRLLDRGDRCLATLPVSRKHVLSGPRPVVAAAPMLELPPVLAGGTSAGTLTIANAGDEPLAVHRPDEAAARQVAPGTSVAIPVSVGPPYTTNPERITGHFPFLTNAPLPYWQYLAQPFALETVAVSLETRRVDFGDVRYREHREAVLCVRRSDHRPGRLMLALPPELQGVIRLTGDMLFFRNLTPRPVSVDGDFTVSDETLGGVAIGMVHLTGRCLVPRLDVSIPALRLVPGDSATAQVVVRDAGGGLEIGTVTSDQPWAEVEQRDTEVWVRVATRRRERGTKAATLRFPSNDFFQPLQEHRLLVTLTPTLLMRLSDRLQAWGRWLVALLIRLIKRRLQ